MSESLNKRDHPLMDFEKRALADLEAPILTILNGLREDIEKGSYDVVLCDDASGRNPSFVIWNVLKKMYTQRGLTPPIMRYVSGRSGTTSESKGRLDEYIDHIKRNASKDTARSTKILIVTDVIQTGQSLIGILEALKRHALAFDIASIAMIGYEGTKESLEKEYGCKIVYATHELPAIYNTALNGVIKQSEYVIAQPSKFPAGAKHIAAARTYLQEHLVPKLIDDYKIKKM